ncbi:MAG: hypothetical protein J3Q66DRAFT_394184 [Benniella sp.]|nr:MAG: hypothetical protein J3Q66DRAFT_394184 [Benniella sp.]
MSTERSSPSVLIVGGGIGGLMLAILLERSNIPYHIYEQAAQVRPLGAAMTVGGNILPVFEQLGLLEEIESISLPCNSIDIYNGRQEKLGSIVLEGHRVVTGYESLIFERPKFYDILRRQVPDHKISMNKKVLRTTEKDGKVTIHCADSTTYEGDILVGADGVYSSIRQNMYKKMDEQGLLPKSDLEGFTVGYITTVGVAYPQNPGKYPQLAENISHFSSTIGENNQTWTVIGTPDKSVCWGVSIQLPKAQVMEQQYQNSEWSAESNEAMLADFRDKVCPWGGTMGEIIDATPKDRITKFFLEERVFKTWHHGHTVLIGDACHKMLPSAGQGAVNAMQDAVVLANCLHNMTDSSPRSIKAVFQEYYRQRFDRAALQAERSRTWTKIISGHTWFERFIRHLMLNYVPSWLLHRSAINMYDYRPQITWLPLTQERGTGRALPQEGRRDTH